MRRKQCPICKGFMDVSEEIANTPVRITCSRCRRHAVQDKADLADATKKLNAMHRRCQQAEAGLGAWEAIKAKSDGSVKSLSRALLVATIQKTEAENDELQAERDALLKLTESLDSHPDDYDGPCRCKTCQSYEADNHDPRCKIGGDDGV